MKRLITLTIVGLAVLVVVTAGFPLLAEERRPAEREHRGEHMMTRLAETLELTEEQRAELSAIMEEQRTGAVDGQREAALEAKRRLQTVVGDPEADEQAVIDAVGALSAETEKLALEQHRLTLEIAEVLTAEQMDKFQELAPRRMERFERRSRRHGRSGDGA